MAGHCKDNRHNRARWRPLLIQGFFPNRLAMAAYLRVEIKTFQVTVTTYRAHKVPEFPPTSSTTVCTQYSVSGGVYKNKSLPKRIFQEVPKFLRYQNFLDYSNQNTYLIY